MSALQSGNPFRLHQEVPMDLVSLDDEDVNIVTDGEETAVMPAVEETGEVGSLGLAFNELGSENETLEKPEQGIKVQDSMISIPASSLNELEMRNASLLRSLGDAAKLIKKLNQDTQVARERNEGLEASMRVLRKAVKGISWFKRLLLGSRILAQLENQTGLPQAGTRDNLLVSS